MLDMLNSDEAITALISGAMGAFFGALGAQIIALFFERINRVRRDLSYIAAAHTLTANYIINYIRIKSQLSKPLVENYFSERDKIEKLIKDARSRKCRGAIKFVADLQKIDPPHFNITQLQDIVYGNLTLTGRAAVSFFEMTEAHYRFCAVLSDRNNLISEWHKENIRKRDDFIDIYFGFEANGNRDEVYKNNIEGIGSYIDDFLFFSCLFERHLVELDRLRRRWWKFFLIGAPRISVLNLDKPRELSLIPSDEKYRAWLDGFVLSPSIKARLLAFAKYRPEVTI